MTRYEQGFIKRASELGYDGASLLKEARKAIPKTGLDKVRSLAREYFGHISGKNVRKARADLARTIEASRKNRRFVDKYNELFSKRTAARDAIGKHVDRLDKEYVDLIRPARYEAKERLAEAIQHRKNAITGTAVGAADVIGGIGLGALLAKPYNDSRKKK